MSDQKYNQKKYLKFFEIMLLLGRFLVMEDSHDNDDGDKLMKLYYLLFLQFPDVLTIARLRYATGRI